MKNIIIGLIVGWLTCGFLFAKASEFWNDHQKIRIITLLEQIEENTRK